MDILAPNRFFRCAEMEYLFFDPKNGALGTNTEKPLRGLFSASVTSPNGHILAPNVFFCDADMKTMLFDPKNCELSAYLRKLEIANNDFFFNPLKEPKSNFSPQNHFLHGAEMEYLFFDPKNGALGTNTEKPL